MFEIHPPVDGPAISRAQLDELRRTIWQHLGALPPRCDLEVQRIDEVERDDVVREELRYQLEPGEWVTGYVARPRGAKGRLPAMAALHSHGGNYAVGKGEIFATCPPDPAREFYGWGYELARRGYVVICQDQLCFEDRSWINTRGVSPGALHEHFEGFHRAASGRTLMGKLAYDTSRAIDVLGQRDDVDMERVGVMGHSGGGSQSFVACVYDPRVKAAVLNCGIASAAATIRDTRTASHTSSVPGITQLGDEAAVVAAMAPRAVLITNGSEDWLFPTDGILNTYYRAKQAYEALGIADRIDFGCIAGPHVFAPYVRAVGYDWLDRWLVRTPIDSGEVWYGADRPDPAPLERRRVDVEGLRDLCGRYGARPEPQPRVRKRVDAPVDPPARIEEVRITVDDTPAFDNKRVRLEPPNDVSTYLAGVRQLVDMNDHLDLWVGRPASDEDRKPAALLIHRSVEPFDVGRDEVMGFGGDPAYALGPSLTAQGRVVAAMDLFGHGQRANRQAQRKWPSQPERSFNFPAIHFSRTGTSLLERTIHEIRAVVSWLRERDDVDPDAIDVIGFETGGFAALMTAVLEPAIRSVVAVGGVTTQAAAIDRQIAEHYFLYQPGLLPTGDVDGALSLLAPRPCCLIHFEDDSRWPCEGAETIIGAMKPSYERAGRSDALSVCRMPGEPAMDSALTAQILEWLEARR
ncbi:MAG: hypothetical protein CMJ18_22520 [Phycisphaeraceae bacterium]|nr:hypothetical protein [Phycisphaeraceae bacterium]